MKKIFTVAYNAQMGYYVVPSNRDGLDNGLICKSTKYKWCKYQYSKFSKSFRINSTMRQGLLLVIDLLDFIIVDFD